MTRRMKPMSSSELQDNMMATYFYLRLGIVVLSASLPWLLLGYSWFVRHEFVENSMSAFYGAYGFAMRDYFVGILWSVGWFLINYKGFSTAEDWALNVAGASAILLSINPCYCWTGVGLSNRIHTTFAIMFFVAMIYVCWFCAYDTISLLPDDLESFYEQSYRWIGWALVSVLVGALIVHLQFPEYHRVVFAVEGAAVTIFAGYWATKSLEFRASSAEKRALKGELIKVKDHGLVDTVHPKLRGTAVQPR